MTNLPGVSKTAVLTLRARATESARPDRLFADPWAVEWFEKVGWDDSLDAWFDQERVPSLLAFRAHELDLLTADAVSKHGAQTVVELGAGLSSRANRCAALGYERWVDVDLEPIAEVRRSLGALGEQLAYSVLDDGWMEVVTSPEQTFIIAEGLLYYLPADEVDALFSRLRSRFAGALMAFDLVGALDFPGAQRLGEAIGAPILWKSDGFTASYDRFGVEILDGWEPDALMRASVDRYWPRFGKIAHLTVKAFARMSSVAEQRTGTVVGRLRPLP